MLNRLKFLIALIVLSVGLATTATPTFAQTVGSHLGVGDIGGQINNINVLKANGAGGGFPVTALMNVNTAANNEQGMQDLAGAISSAGFYPIIRITNVCDSGLSQSQVQAAVTNINAAFGDVVIVYGNEVNNQDHECKDWDRYMTEYNWVSGMPNVVPSALDYYMGNPAYTTTKFFADTSGANAAYSNGSAYAANAYGCVGARDANCEPGTTTTQEVGYSRYSGKTLYLTEFSLSPEGRVPDAPDTNIQKVIEFIQSRAGSTGARFITPLVRNVCNDEGEWLLYVNGRLFTMSSTEVTDNCEGNAGAGSGYDLSAYPDYEVLQELYYLHPVSGLHPDSLQGRRVSSTRNDLAAQGYEAHCAAESTSIKLDFNTEELINRFLELYPSGVKLQTESHYTLNATGAQVSIFRDTNDKRYLTSSLEEYFGFKDVYNKDTSSRELSTAPINSLLSQDQKCAQAVELLKNTQLMCERLADPSQCALLAREIPDTDYNVSTLLDDISEAIPEYRAGGVREGCRNLYQSDSPQWDELKQGLQNTPLHLDRSYRLAFLVASIENRSAAESFNFFSLLPSADPTHEVLVVAFKIPDILTNKGGGEASGHTFFTDAASMTRDILVPRAFKVSEDETNPGFNKESRDKRTILAEHAAQASSQSVNSEIYCIQGNGDTDSELAPNIGSSACKNVAGKAVVDIINGQTPSCDNLEAEPVRQILEAANIVPPAKDDPTRLFNPGYGLGSDILNYLFIGSTNKSIQEASNEKNPFASIFDIVSGSWNNPKEEAEVNFYLVYPVGYELESVTTVLKHTFFTENQVAELSKNDTTGRFETSGFTSSLTGGSVSHTFEELPSSGQCEETTVLVTQIELPNGEFLPVDPPYEETRYDCSKEFSVSIKEEGSGGVNILGAHLGYWVRNIQKSLNTYYGYAHAYVSSCRTTEEFLTGTCAGGPANTIDNSGSPNLAGASYCVDWNRLTSAEVESIKTATRDYLTSFEYNYVQTAARYDAVAAQQFFDWNGRLIDPGVTNFYENYYGGGRALLWTKSAECDNKACFDYVMDECGAAGINPAVCVGMSITESGGLNHIRFPGSDDFGCIAGQPNNVRSQLDCLINKFFLSSTPRDGGVMIQNMDFNQMWLEFSGPGFAASSYPRLEDFLLEIQSGHGDVGYTSGVCK